MNKAIMYVLALAMVMAGASALTISSPSEGESFDGLVDVMIEADANETALAYVITKNGSEEATDDCENCSQLNASLNLTEGSYVLLATATGDNLSVNESVTFTVELAEDNVTALELTIEEPENQTYDDDVSVEITTNIASDISWQLNDGNVTAGCENCTEFEAELELEDGNYTFTAFATAGNQSVNQSVDFIVELDEESDNETEQLELTIESPEDETYDDDVSVEITTNMNADISWSLNDGNQTLGCENCIEFEADLELEEGDYTFMAFATAGNMTVNESVDFTVEFSDENETDDDNESDPRFAEGFNKLPQMVAAGEISDEELADILRNNQLNPGIINRLVKTGQLGNESINAIIEEQWTPPGILRKVLGFFGMNIPTPKEALLQEYDLNDEQLANLATQNDVQKRTADKIAKQLRDMPPGQAKKIARADSSDSDDNTPRGNQKTLDVGGQDRTPPGLEKQGNGRGNGRANAPGQNR